jgi:hypothetical protein
MSFRRCTDIPGDGELFRACAPQGIGCRLARCGSRDERLRGRDRARAHRHRQAGLSILSRHRRHMGRRGVENGPPPDFLLKATLVELGTVIPGSTIFVPSRAGLVLPQRCPECFPRWPAPESRAIAGSSSDDWGSHLFVQITEASPGTAADIEHDRRLSSQDDQPPSCANPSAERESVKKRNIRRQRVIPSADGITVAIDPLIHH